MRYLGIDFGMKRLGIAISDDGGSFAFPRDVIENDSNAQKLIKELVESEKISALIVGDTLTLNGGENDITVAAGEFAARLEEIGVPVHRVREAWSSQEADRFAPQGRKHNDSAAAAIILQRFLDAHTK